MLACGGLTASIGIPMGGRGGGRAEQNRHEGNGNHNKENIATHPGSYSAENIKEDNSWLRRVSLKSSALSLVTIINKNDQHL